MNNINEISTLELSEYVNSIRKILLTGGFFEHHLYSTVNYKIESMDTFNIENELYLRSNPEPEIWNIGEKCDAFFWIGSLFRKEKTLTHIHKKEFTVVDIYLKEKNMTDIIQFFLKTLGQIERELKLPNISKYPLEYVQYRDFNKDKLNTHKTHWLIVTDYPVEESFYDEQNTSNNATKKFEIYFVEGNDATELAVGGILGKNLNKIKFIKSEDKFVNKGVFDKKFIGFGFGVERLIYLYKNNKK